MRDLDANLPSVASRWLRGAPQWLLRVRWTTPAAIALVLAGPWLLDTYTLNILIRALFVAIVALTVDVLWGFSGTLTFGQSAFFGIGAYGLAIVFTQFGFGPWQVLLALGAAVGVAAAVAGFVGWLSFYPGSTPLYVSVISLVLPIVVVQLLYSGGAFTGSSSGLVGFETFDLSLEGWFLVAGFAMIAVLATTSIMVSSDAGRMLSAMRDNDERCTYLGINTSLIRIWLLVATGVAAALAGFGYVAFSGVAAPENAGFIFGTQLVIMVALGGRGSLAGAVVGAIVIEVASAYLSSSLPFIWELIVGVTFVVVIVVLPGGLFGIFRTFGSWLRGKHPRASGRDAAGIAIETRQEAVAIPDPDAVVVEVENVSKHFGSLSVLSDVSFTARRGELVSIVGPNGAGKTTLIRCLADGRERSEGQVRIGGRSIERLPPDQVVRLGLGRKFQAASVFETLRVADCLRIARSRRDKPSFLDVSSVLRLPPAARAVAESSGLAARLDEEARFLSHGLKQALELAMVLALEPQVLLLDEPTAGLTRVERQAFASVLRELVVRERLCVLIIEHDLDFVRQISSRILLLHQGQVALDGPVADVVNNPLIREIYTGNHQSKRAKDAPP